MKNYDCHTSRTTGSEHEGGHGRGGARPRGMGGAALALWAAVSLVVPAACDSGGDGGDGPAGTTGMDEGTSTGGMADEESGDSTGRPMPVPPPDAGGGTDEDPTCEAYCAVYTDACQDFSEYANEQHCLDNCAQWPVGTAADAAGDTLGCRTYHATVAASTDAELHCPHAGPSGELVCVAEDAPTCDLYCTRYFGNCEGDLNLWADMDACMSECAAWYPGTATDDHGHTIGCRAFYANLAAGDPELHCPSAGPGGGDVCVLGG